MVYNISRLSASTMVWRVPGSWANGTLVRERLLDREDTNTVSGKPSFQ